MFRRVMLSAILGTGLVSGLAMTPATADAASPANFRHRYEVMVRSRFGWENRGTFRDHFEAERMAHRLRHQGFTVEIREF